MKQIFKFFLRTSALFLIPLAAFAQPINDKRNDATVLKPEIANEYFVFTAALKDSKREYPACSPKANDDVWYKFNAESNQYILGAYNFYVPTNALMVELWKGEANEPLACTSLTTINPFLDNLAKGQTYYLRIYNTDSLNKLSEVQLGFAKRVPLAYEDCAKAKEVIISDEDVYVTDKLVSDTNALSPCLKRPVHSLWLVFTAQHYRYDFAAYGFRFHLFESCSSDPFVCEEQSPGNNTIWERRYNLTKGKKYYIQLLIPAGNALSYYNIRIQPVKLSAGYVVNDTCNGALQLKGGDTYQFTNLPQSYHCGQEFSSCNVPNTVDTWYKFKAESSTHSIAINPTVSGLPVYGFEVFDGCLTRQSLGCFMTSEAVVKNLVVGKEYLIKANDSFTGGLQSSYLQIGTKKMQTIANDECASALDIPLAQGNSELVQGDMVNATLSSDSNKCAQEGLADVWYKFTAGASKQYINIRAKNIAYEVYEECGGKPIACCKNALLKLDKLAIGKKYLIRVIKTTVLGTKFTLTIQKTSNSECATPSHLDVSKGVIYAQSSLGTGYEGSYSGCSSGYHDGWFTFIATKTKHLMYVQSPKTLIYTLGTDICTGTNAIQCGTIGSGLVTLENLMVGQTYLFKLSAQSYLSQKDSNTFAFNVAIQEFVNDDCANALEINYGDKLDGNFTLATASSSYCDNSSSLDMWYKFKAKSSPTSIQLQGNNIVSFELFKGSCTGTKLFCSNNAYLSSLTRVFNLEKDESYYVRIVRIDYRTTGFQFQLSEGTNLVGDICNTAKELLIKDGIVSTSFSFETYGSEYKACSEISKPYLPDQWIKFKPRTQRIKIAITANSGSFELYESCSLDKQLKCKLITNSYSEIFVLDTSRMYYARISSDLAASTSFLMSVLPLAPNDECETPNILNPLLTASDSVKFDFVNSSVSSKKFCNNYEYGYDDVWYQFIPSTTWIELGFRSTNTVGIAIYDSCNASSYVYCSTTLKNTDKLLINALIANKKYLIRIYRNQIYSGIANQKTSLYFKNILAPSNDLCANAIPLTTSDTGYVMKDVVLLGATNDNPQNAKTPDVWYSFVAQNKYVSARTMQYENRQYYFGVYDACNGKLVMDSYNYLNTAATLQVGRKYFVNVSNNDITRIDAISVGVRMHPSPSNDSCNKAITLTPSRDKLNYTRVNVKNVGAEGYNGCESDPFDVWFKFVPNTNSTTIKFKKIGTYTSFFSVFKGNDCGSKTHLYCRKTDTSMTFATEKGSTYYINVYNMEANFITDRISDIAIRENQDVSNISCATASEIVPSNNTLCNETKVDFTIVPMTSSTQRLGLWFKFKTVDSLQIIKITSATNNIKYYFYESCDTWNTIRMISDKRDPSFSYRMRYDKFKPNVYYYLFVEYTVTPQDQPITSFCIYNPKPINDECANALPLTDSCDVRKMVDMFNASRSFPANCTKQFASDVWFKFKTTSEAAVKYALELTTAYDNYHNVSTTSHQLEIMENCANSSPRCIKRVEKINGIDYYNQTIEFMLDSLKANTQYLLRLIVSDMEYSATNLSYRFIKSMPYTGWSNDMYLNQGIYYPYNSPTNCFYFQKCQTSSLYLPYNGYPSTPIEVKGFHDNWLQFKAEDSTVSFTMDNNYYFELYPQGSLPRYNTTNLNEFYRVNQDSLAFYTAKLDSGSIYILRIAERGQYGSYSRFGNVVCIQSLKKIDKQNSCKSPTQLLEGEWTSARLLTDNLPKGTKCAPKGSNTFRWFRFNAGDGTKSITLDGVNNSLGAELYHSCDSLIQCFPGKGVKSAFNLQLDKNKDYLLRVYSNIKELNLDFRILLSENLVTSVENDSDINEEIEVYPNPAENIVYLRGVKESSPLSIIDVNGRRVLTAKVMNGQVFLGQLLPGIYMIDVETKKVMISIIK